MFWFSKKRIILLFLLPTLLIYIAYIIIPIFISVYYSFTEFSGIGHPKFIGWSNYSDLIHDPLFWVSFKNTLIVLIVAFIVLLPGGFLLSLIFYSKIKGNSLIKALNFAPIIVAPIIIGLIWVFILDPKIGLLNGLLNHFGLHHLALKWIGGKTLSPYSIGVVFSWEMIGFVATIFLAGLTMIPQDLYEAGSIDGANRSQQMWFITIPMLKETFTIIVLLIITHALRIFDIVYQLTNGGPNHFSEVLVTYMYHMTFTSSEYGYGMSISVVTSLLIIFISLVYLKFTRNTDRET